MNVKTKKDYRDRRHLRLRKKIKGTAERPRMAVFKSNKNLCVQCIDDRAGVTLAACSSFDKEAKDGYCNKEQARDIGKRIAEKLQAANVDTVVFDTGGFGYEGKVKDLAEAAREAGLKF